MDELYSSQLTPRLRKAVFLIIVTMCLVNSAIVFIPRSIKFAKNPTIPFKTIASNYGIQFNRYAEDLGISNGSLLCPDLGGTLYFSHLKVYDLAGLCDRKLAKLISGNPTDFRNYILDHLRPTFIHIHGYWSLVSGFSHDARFRESYVAIQEVPNALVDKQGHIGVYSGDYVLKAALASEKDIERLRQRIRENMQQGHVPNEEKTRPFPRG
jgi:hypothetical protein